jgi:hypothetical protein
MSLMPCFNSLNAARPRVSSARAYLVGSTPRELRSKSFTPSACSRSAMTCDTAGWETRRCAAALVRLPDCMTAKNTRMSRNRKRRPMWSSQSAIFATSARFRG